jgi:D-alanine transaminase
VLEICQKSDILTSESPIYENRIHLASELMITGTTTEVTPIVALNGRPVGNGKPGPTARALQAAYADLTSL